jgi:hypothetical protein
LLLVASLSALFMGLISVGPVAADGNYVGCTPGYWKQSQHFGNWTPPYDPGDLFSDHFANAFPGMTLLDVLGQGGGGIDALGRHTVAALLNGAYWEFHAGGYDFGVLGLNDTWTTPDDVIRWFNEAFNGERSIRSLKDAFEDANETGCPLARA